MEAITASVDSALDRMAEACGEVCGEGEEVAGSRRKRVDCEGLFGNSALLDRPAHPVCEYSKSLLLLLLLLLPLLLKLFFCWCCTW